MRSRAMLGALALTSCISGQEVLVAPRPAVSADSASRTAFAMSAMALLERVASEDSLERTDDSRTQTDSIPMDRSWAACYERAGFRLCGRMEDSPER